MNQALRNRLDEVNERIDDRTGVCRRKWAKFEAEREKFVAAGGTKADSAEFKAADEAEAEYKAAADEVESLEKSRSLIFGEIAKGQDQVTASPDAVKPGEWLKKSLDDAKFKTLTSGSGLGDAITPSEYTSFFFDRLAAMSAGLQSGFTVINTAKNSVVVPRITADPAADWTSEGSNLPLSDPTGDAITITPQKLGVVESITREVWRDSEPAVLAMSEHSIIRGIALKLDLGFFEGTGSAPQPRGLKNVVGIQTVSMGTNGLTPVNLDPFADAIGLLETENAMTTAMVMHPRSWKTLMKLKEQTSGNNKPLLQESSGPATAGIERSLYGIPVYLSSQLSITETQGAASTASSVYVYDASQVVAVQRQNTEVDVFEQYDFRGDAVGVRATCRWGLAVPNPKAVVAIQGLLP